MQEQSAPTIRRAGEDDAPALVEIYNHYIRHSVSTFDEQPLPPLEFSSRLQAASERRMPWLLAEQAGRVLGFACANPWKQKSAYRFIAETSIYLEPRQLGRGLGSRLYGELIRVLREDSPIRQAVACIALPNPASVRLHEGLGFEPVGEFRRVGYKFERWIDVGYWQLAL